MDKRFEGPWFSSSQWAGHTEEQSEVSRAIHDFNYRPSNIIITFYFYFIFINLDNFCTLQFDFETGNMRHREVRVKRERERVVSALVISKTSISSIR